MTTARTQVFKDSWAHTALWPPVYKYPPCTDYRYPGIACRTAERAALVARAFWQEVAEEIHAGVVGIRLE